MGGRRSRRGGREGRKGGREEIRGARVLGPWLVTDWVVKTPILLYGFNCEMWALWVHAIYVPE